MLVPPPADLPSPHPTTAFWQVPASPIADLRSTPDLPSVVDWAVVGSGIAGSTIALKLLEARPDTSVVLLEARQACSGASGRNVSIFTYDLKQQQQELTVRVKNVVVHGLEEAIKISRFEEQNIRSVAEFVRSHSVDCDLHAVETVDLFWDDWAWQDALRSVGAWRAALADDLAQGSVSERIVHGDANQARDKFNAPSALGAISYPAYTVSPYKLTCGILQIALRRGLNLQTHTPVLALASTASSELSSGGCWELRTPRGSIVAKNVVLATNAYTSHLCPILAKGIVPTRAQACVMRPGARTDGEVVLKDSFGFTYPSGVKGVQGGDYMMTRPLGSTGAGHVIFGGGRLKSDTGEQPCSDDSTVNETISAYLRGAPRRHFGDAWASDSKALHEWTGIMGYTVDGHPYIGEMPSENLWICAGFNGHGMGLAFRSATAVVSIMTGDSADETNEWLPRAFRLERAPFLKASRSKKNI